MKLTSAAVIFALIVSVFFSINNYRISNLENRAYVERYYKKVLEKASEDASSALKKSAVLDIQGLVTDIEIQPEEIFETFFRSFGFCVGINDSDSRSELAKYFPVLAIIEEDGIILNSYIEYSSNNSNYINRVIKKKLRFFYSDGDVMYFPQLSGKVTCLYEENKKWVEETGTPEELLNTPFRTKNLDFLSKPGIEKTLKKIISEQITDIISEEIQKHKKIVSGGIRGFDFYVPSETDGIVKSISSPTFIAIMQGYRPFDESGLTSDIGINCVNLNRLEISKSDFYIGFIHNGVKYYVSADETETYKNKSLEAFTNELDAVKSGYYKWKNN